MLTGIEKILFVVETLFMFVYSSVGYYVIEEDFYGYVFVMLCLFSGIYIGLIMLGYIGVYCCSNKWIDSTGRDRYYPDEHLNKNISEWISITSDCTFILSILMYVIVILVGIATEDKHLFKKKLIAYSTIFIGSVVVFQIVKIFRICKIFREPVQTK